MFAPRNNGPPPSYHSSANSSLVGGFGGDDGFDSDPPQYDWAMAADVGSPREEQRPSTRPRIAQREQPLASSSHEAPRRAHYYRATSAEIMADFDFPVPTPKQTPAVTETAGPSTSPARPQRGYLLPTPASILAGFDVAPFSPQTTGGSTSTAATTPPMPSPSTRPAYNSRLDSWSANNPYVALLEQKEQAMTLAFLRSQDAGSGSRSADLAADDFRWAVPLTSFLPFETSRRGRNWADYALLPLTERGPCVSAAANMKQLRPKISQGGRHHRRCRYSTEASGQ